jgi:tRNA/tmRNA/rRNA uracil-C5-methylase (TrmA/RlmC/RlmD family)
VSLPACPHRPPCPGCPRYGEPGIDPASLARLSQLARRAGLPAPAVHEGAAQGFRHRARLMLRGRAGAPELGIFERGSHRVVDIPRCRIHHPLVNEVAEAVRRAVRETGTVPYDDAAHAGELRAVQIGVARDRPRVQLVLVGNAPRAEPLHALAARIGADLGVRLESLWWNGNPDRTNAILGPHWEHLAGEEALRVEVAGVEVFYWPGAFAQSHPDLAERLVARLRAWVPDGATLAELHAGAGPIGLGLLARAAQVRFNEVSPHALAGLRRGLAARPAAERARAVLAEGPAEARLDLLDGADAVVVDPPRKGLAPALCDALVARPPRRLVYASCGLDAFLRDAARLMDAGSLRLAALEAYALFPYTGHVETAARFERAGA